jgi:hypothetical protein
VIPFVQGILFGMHLVNSQETQEYAARDSGSMPLGTSMLQGSHCGSNRTGDDCGVGGHGGNRHQRSWMTQQLLSAPLLTSPPFISKQKELGGYKGTGDALRSGCPVRHAPGELTRDSGSMPLGTSLLQGSHLGSNRTGDDGGCQRFAFPDEDHDDDATDDALCSGRPVWHAPGELTRDSGSMPLGTSLPRRSHLGSNCRGDNEDGCIGDHHQGSQLTCIPHVLPMVVFLMNPLAAWRAHYSETRRTLSTRYTGI